MNINIKSSKAQKKEPNTINSEYLTDRYGCWGKVIEVNSRDCTVKVLLDVGRIIQGIPVASREWVCIQEDYVTGERNLPSVNSIVFVFMPSGKIESAFVLCSCLFPENTELKNTFMGNDLENIREQKLPGGWNIIYENDTGNFTLCSKDKKNVISFEENTVKVEINSAKIAITEDGSINVTAADEKNISLNGNKYSLTAYGPLLKGLQDIVSDLNIEMGKIASGIASAGGAYTPAPFSVDISQSELHTLKAGK